jgi:GT2 family glycosyltransferase
LFRKIIPQVNVIILNWNNYEDTKKCLESLQKATYSNLSVTVVDNGSADGSGKRLQTEFPDIQFIFNEKNLGFARGCNVGIRAALRDEDCAYVLLLNNDSVFTPDFLEKAVEIAEADRQVGLVGGKVLQSPETKKIWYAGGHINLWRGQAVTRHGQIDFGQYDKPEEVGFVTGGLMLIRREVLEKVGLLPEEYFFGVEEYDYSLSVKKAGYKLYYVPDFLVYHRGDGSHWNYDPKYVYNYYRNKLILQEKFLPKGLFPMWKLAFVIYGKYLARRQRKKIIKHHHYDKERPVLLDDLDYALMRAVKDHGKNVLCEEALREFEEALRNKKNEE